MPLKNVVKTFKYQLYLLQLENYELGRYFKLLFKKGFLPKGEQRKNLVWTSKAKALMLMAVGLHLLITIVLIKYNPVGAVVVFVLIFTFYFALFTLSLLLLWPLDFVLKQIIIIRAKSKIKSLTNIKIIGIAGSYGKTTMKEVLTQVTSVKCKVKSTPESVNTPVGISRWILKNVDSSTKILIAEMGEHYKGDIKEICEIVKPDISVVTGINESHLERMRTMGTIVETVFEVVSGTKAGGMVVLNSEDELVMKSYLDYIWPDHKREFYAKNTESIKRPLGHPEKYEGSTIESAIFSPENLGWNIQIQNVGQAFVSLLGEYALGDVDAAVKIGRSLGMTNQDIIAGIKNIKPVEHRLQPIKSNGNILIIDDAYNGNPDGVREAIKVLSRFENSRKVFITPGLVEMGKASEAIHRQIGKELAGVADVVVLIKNSVTPWVEQGISEELKAKSYKLTAIQWFNTAQEAHSSLGKILKPNDVILFQNDWGDQYL
jgi:UDP-N-acetylmuramoyl-tripeptide--D-alanyl-D-alanine ligase